MSKYKNKIFSKISILSLTIIISIFVGSVLLFKTIQKEDNTNLLYQEVIDNKGSYNPNKLVLKNTTKEIAEDIAKRLNSKLRITSGGEFATITLQEDITIESIVSNPENKDILEYLSLDYRSSISQLEEEIEEIIPTSKPEYSVNDEFYELQIYLDYLNLGRVWANYKGDSKTIAVIDTGIDTDHIEFSGKISEYSYNATEDKIVKDHLTEDGSYDWSLIEDEQGHGTAVAGVIAADMNNNEGIVGIAPNVELIVIKAECDEYGNFYSTSDLVFGLYYAIERDVDVVNMSFGGEANFFEEPAKLAVDSDIICVAAAGNNGSASLTYPAADENVIGVGALAENSWELASYSNYGESVNIVAPGTVYTTKNDGSYQTIHGTSFSSPIVAAIITLQMQKDYYNYAEFEEKTQLLYASAKDLSQPGPDFYYGYGAIDVYEFLFGERFTVTFDYLTEEIENTQCVVIKDHALQFIPEPERLYSVFDGWYYDIHCTEEINEYVDKWVNDITIYASWANEDDTVPYTYNLLEDNTIEITGYIGKRRFITIPDYIDGYPVSTIGEAAFKDETRLRVINLPKTLTTIKDSSFSNCINLTNMDIPDNVKYIGSSAFTNNIRLYTINFTENSKLEYILDSAFSHCTNLIRFDIPKNVIYDENNLYGTGNIFFGCTNLKQINAHKKSQYYSSIDGVLFNKTKTTLIAYPAGKKENTYDLLNSVTKLGIASFSFSSIKTIDLKNVEIINDFSFSSSSISEVIISDKVTHLGKYVFAMSKISDITLGKGINVLSEYLFNYTQYLNKIIIPNSITKIENGCFSNSNILEVIFEDNSKLEIIESEAFGETCINSFNLPDTVISIGKGAFAKCYFLDNFEISKNSKLTKISASSFQMCENLKNIYLPDSLLSLDAQAFRGTGLVEVTIPKNLIVYSPNAFASCEYLENIFVDDDNQYYVDIDGVVYTKDLKTLYEYPAGKNTIEYKVLDSVTKIGEFAFYGSKIIQNVILPDGLEIISAEAFTDCISMNTYNLPESLIEIGSSAFSNNTLLRTLFIPKNVYQLGSYLVNNNKNLYSITFDENIKLPRLSYATFYNCGVQEIKIPKSVSTISQSVFERCDNLRIVRFEQDSQLTSISAYLFNGCSSLEKIIFEKGSALTSIQAHGLEGMEKLISIDFGDAKITNIDNFAFRYCDSLKSINIPETVEYIGRYAFYGCKTLSEVHIPETVEYIGRYAFYLTNNLNVYFKASILPLYLQENWDYGISGYYIGVKEIYEYEDYTLAKLNNDKIAIIKYNGTQTNIDLSTKFNEDLIQIGGYAFANSKVETIKLPDSILMIDRYAFAYSNIKNINMPKNVEQIADFTFYASSLELISFTNDSKLKKIGASAFRSCYKLTNIEIPLNVEILGSYCFYESGLEEINFNENIKLESIEESTFAATKLKEITIPNSVRIINNNAFRDTTTLTKVNYGTNSLQIRSHVFYNTGLTNVYIPSNIEYIGEYAFVGLEKLEQFVVDENNPYYKSIDGVLFSKNEKKLIAFPGNRTGSYTVPNTVEIIGFGAFENTKLTEVNFSENINLLTLGYRVFYNAKNLKEITIPSSVISIDYYAFAMCKNLETVNIDQNAKFNGIYEGAFYGCINLKNITLPNNIYEISDYAFYGCISLEKIPITEESNLLGIYDYAFANSGIKTLNLPQKLLDIGNYAFRGTKLEEVVIPNEYKDELLIGIGAFRDCDQLVTISIPFVGSDIRNLYANWFGYIFGAGSENANNVYIPKSLENVIITEGTEIIYAETFKNCESIKSITLPSSLIKIEKSAFTSCKSLEEVIFEENSKLERIEREAFFECSSLINIKLQQNVNYIGYSAFSDCTSLESIEIPQKVTKLNGSTFYNCSSLKNVTLHQGLKQTYDYDFGLCTSLENVYYYGTISDWLDIEMIEKKYPTKGYPNPMTYAKHFYMLNSENEFEEVKKLTIPEHITHIPDYRFKNFTLLEELTIPENIESIGNNAFEGCANLKQIRIGENVKTISANAFYNCSNVETIYIPNGLNCITSNININSNNLQNVYYDGSIYDWFNIEENTNNSKKNNLYKTQHFYVKNNNNVYEELTELEIPENITRIDEHEFDGVTFLKKVNIPSNVTYVGPYAFNNCANLEEVILTNSTTISASAFNFCENLKTLYLPQNIEFSNQNFSQLLSLKNIYFYGTFDDYCNFEKTPHADNKLQLFMQDENSKWYEVEEIYIGESVTEIKDYRFKNLLSLKKVYISKNVTIIGSGAFSDCDNLQLVVIEESSKLNTISLGAFNNCNKLIEVINGSDINLKIGSRDDGYIAYYAMKVDNKGVISYKNPDSTVYQKFTTADNLEFLLYNNEYYLLSYHGSDEIIKLPLLINGSNYYCNYMDNSIRNVELIGDINYIPDEMFKNANNLESVILPNNLVSIGNSSFEGCSKITQIVIPENVTSIGSSAFLGCYNLDTVENYSRLTFVYGLYDYGYIAAYATNVINYNNSDTYITTQDGFIIYLINDQYYLLSYVGNDITPIIPIKYNDQNLKYSLMDKSLKNIELSKELTTISGGMFENCKYIESIIIPESVTTINNNAFYNCISLNNVYYRGNITDWLNIYIGKYNSSNPMTYAKHFYMLDENNNWYEPKEIYVDESITEIPQQAFYNFTSLEKVTIGKNVTGISNEAFYNCVNLQSIVVLGNPTWIGINAFSNCTSLIDYYYGGTLKGYLSCSYNSTYSRPMYFARKLYFLNENEQWEEVTNLTIPDNITAISAYAFANLDSLEYVYISSSVTMIGSEAFKNCKNLKVVEIAKDSKIKSIGYAAFYECSSLKDIYISSTIKNVYNMAFYNCHSLENVYINSNPNNWSYINFISGFDNPMYYANNMYYLDEFNKYQAVKNITIPKDITIINDYQFYNISSLETITFHDDITYIGAKAFANCISLKVVEMPTNLKKLLSDSFYNCTSLKTIFINNEIENMENAFEGCKSLTDIYYNGTISDWSYIKFRDNKSNPAYYASNIYMKDNNNEYDIVTNIIVPTDINNIGISQYVNMKFAESITFGSNITSFSSYCFNDCENLKNVYFAGTIEEWNNLKLENSYNGNVSNPMFYADTLYVLNDNNEFELLVDLVIPDSMTSISTNFSGINSINTVTFGKNIETIPYNSFSYCKNLQKVTIVEGSKLSLIANNAFDYCSNLREIDNQSDLILIPGSYDNGRIALYALKVTNKDSVLYKDKFENFEYITTDDGFVFIKGEENYYLISYVGDNERPIIPATIEGQSYSCEYINDTLANIEFSDEFKSIPASMFFGSSILKTIVIPDSVTNIGSAAFYRCENLVSVEMSNNLLSIGDSTFMYCFSLEEITLPKTLKEINSDAFSGCMKLNKIYVDEEIAIEKIGYNAFEGTKFYNDENNWTDGNLYIANSLIKANPDLVSYYLPDNVTCIATAAFDNCQKLIYAEVIGYSSHVFDNCYNVESIVINNLERNGFVSNLFLDIPMTLKNVELKSTISFVSDTAFYGIKNIKIFVDHKEEAVMWDHDTPNWSNENEVYYQNEWIYASFFDEYNKLISKNYYGIYQVIQQPILHEYYQEGYKHTFIGWDLDNDNSPDSVQASSIVNIIAKALYKVEKIKYVVNYYDLDNKTILYTQYYDYNELLVTPNNPDKKGYNFLEWSNLPSSGIVESNIDIYSKWEHVDGYHNYTTITSEATCHSEGIITYICSICDYQYQEIISSKKEHILTDWVIVNDPSCEETGSKYRECSNCDYKEYEEIIEIGHQFEKINSVNSTCTTHGYDEYGCIVCNYKTTQGKELADHNYIKEKVDKKRLELLVINIKNLLYLVDDEFGYYYKCKDCEHIMLENESNIKVNNSGMSSILGVKCEHYNTHKQIVVYANCIKDGYEYTICLDCDEIISVDKVLSIGEHYYEIEYINPTCSEEGYALHICECGNNYKDTYVDALGHNYNSIVTNPTCLEEGYTTNICERCNYTYIDNYVDAKGHTYNDWYKVINETCEQQGLKQRDCINCNHYETNIIEELGHDKIHHEELPATCTQGGHKAYDTCSRCEYSTYEYVPATGHSYSDWYTYNEVTCTTNGLDKRDCINCSHYETKVINSKGHVTEQDDYIKPTCETTGLTGGYHCINCNYKVGGDIIPAEGHIPSMRYVTFPTCEEEGLSHQVCTKCDKVLEENIIPAKGHQLEYHSKLVATCTNNGYEAYERCFICDYTTYKVIPALGHMYTEIITNPTCLEKGYITKKCERCNDSYIDTYIEPTGHNYSNWETISDAKCEEEGLIRRHCEACWIYENKIIEPTGHNIETLIVEPTCELQGYTIDKCINCTYNYDYNYVNSLGHNYNDWHIIKESTCSENGIKQKECLRCQDIQTTLLDKEKHNLVYYDEVKQTCETDGHNSYEKCLNCSYTTYVKYSATGHRYTFVYNKPTCENEGYRTYTCQNCNDSYIDDYVEAYGHNYGSWCKKKNETCTEDGKEERNCIRCGNTEERIIEKLGHDLNYYEKLDPTCTMHGHNAYEECTRCYYTTYEYLESLGHDYNSVITNSSCTQEGYTTHTCTRCFDSYIDSFTNIVDHTYADWYIISDATCEENGLRQRDCIYCNHNEKRIILKYGHNYQQQITNPTCTEYGYTTNICERCNNSYFDSYVNPTGHNLNEWHIINQANCETDGLRQRECTNCNHFEQETIDKLGHVLTYYNKLDPTCEKDGHNAYEICSRCDYSTYEVIGKLGHNYTSVVTQPTCTTEGHTTHTCERCKDSYVDTYVNPTGHNLNEWYIVKQATCETDGLQRRNCTNCRYSEHEKLYKLGHELVQHDKLEPTCETDGHNAYEKCSRCNYSTYKVIEKLGHNYTSVVTQPTCTEKGYTTYTCERCDDSYVRPYAIPTGHSLNEWYTINEPTCETNGLQERKCKNCSYFEQKTINKLGHELTHYNKLDPTCETDGHNAYEECSRCDYSTYKVIEKLGHNYISVVTNPTCLEKGYTTHTCKRCNDSYVSSYVNPTGHNYNEWYIVKQATCETNGLQERKCKNCSYFEQKTINKLGHELTQHNKLDPTCEKDGHNAYEECSRCDYSTYKVIEKLEHELTHYNKLDPTCEKDGHNAYEECSRCDYSTYKVIEKLGHNYISVVTNPTCLEKGYTTHTCERCNDSYVSSYVNPTGHNYNEWYTINEPTCETNGLQERACTNCNHKETSEINSTGHIESEWIIDKEPTKKKTGSKHTECNICKKIIKEEIIQKIPRKCSKKNVISTLLAINFVMTCICLLRKKNR